MTGFNRADLWLGDTAPNGQPGNIELRSKDTARLIAERPVTIAFSRYDPATKRMFQLPPQTVRVEVTQNTYGAKESRDSMLQISRQYVLVVGILNHPTLPDTDLQRADQFFFDGLMYEIVDFINTVPGRLLASGQVTP